MRRALISLDSVALDRVRSSLPPFGTAPGPGLRDYCRQYGLEFAHYEPDLVYRAGAVASGPYRLAAHYWQRPGATATLLIVHGYLDHTGLYGRLIDYGLGRRCNVLIFDLPGHGLSSGEQASIGDFSEYSRAVFDVLRTCVPDEEKLWVLAQSTGCAALTQFATEYPWPFVRTVFLAPLVRPARWAWVRLALWLADGWLKRVSRRLDPGATADQFVVPLAQDPLQSRYIPLSWVRALRRYLAGLPRRDLGVGPVLILQGTADRTVAWRYNLRRLQALYPGSRVVILPEAEHHLANERAGLQDKMFRAIDRWMDEPVPPGPDPMQ